MKSNIVKNVFKSFYPSGESLFIKVKDQKEIERPHEYDIFGKIINFISTKFTLSMLRRKNKFCIKKFTEEAFQKIRKISGYNSSTPLNELEKELFPTYSEVK